MFSNFEKPEKDVLRISELVGESLFELIFPLGSYIQRWGEVPTK